MHPLADPDAAIAFSVWLLLLLLRANEAPHLPALVEGEDEEDNPLLTIAGTRGGEIHDPHTDMRATLNHFRLFLSFNFLDKDIGYSVKPRSTTWFSRFLLEQYES